MTLIHIPYLVSSDGASEVRERGSKVHKVSLFSSDLSGLDSLGSFCNSEVDFGLRKMCKGGSSFHGGCLVQTSCLDGTLGMSCALCLLDCFTSHLWFARAVHSRLLQGSN